MSVYVMLMALTGCAELQSALTEPDVIQVLARVQEPGEYLVIVAKDNKPRYTELWRCERVLPLPLTCTMIQSVVAPR